MGRKLDIKKFFLGEEVTYPNKPGVGLVYRPEEKLPTWKTLTYAFQVVLMSMSLVIGSSVVLSTAGKASSVQMYAMIAGMLIQFGLVLILQPILGHHLLQGAAYNGSVMSLMATIVATTGFAAATGGLLVAALVMAALSLTPFLRWIRRAFTCRIRGTLEFMIVGSLLGTYFLPQLTTSGTSWGTLAFGLILGLCGMLLVIRGKGFVSTIPLIIIATIGYPILAYFGFLQYPTLLSSASFFTIPAILPSGVTFDVATIVTLLIAMLINQPLMDIGITDAVEEMTGAQIPPANRKRGTFINMVCTTVGAFFGTNMTCITGTPSVTWLLTARVANRIIFIVGGVILIILAFLGKFVAVLGMMPLAVAGAMNVVTGGQIIGLAVRTWTSEPITTREMMIIGMPIGMACSALFLPASFYALLPSNILYDTVKLIIRGPVIHAILWALFLEHVLLPRPKTAAAPTGD